MFVSDLALLLVTSGLYKLGATFGWTWLLCTYGMPYLVVNHFLVRAAHLEPAPAHAVHHLVSRFGQSRHVDSARDVCEMLTVGSWSHTDAPRSAMPSRRIRRLHL